MSNPELTPEEVLMIRAWLALKRPKADIVEPALAKLCDHFWTTLNAKEK